MQNDKEKFKKEFISRLIRLAVNVIKCADELKSDRILWSIIDQLIRSVSSIGANVIEAKSSCSRKEYIKFFEIALKSANEAKFWLILIKEVRPKLATKVDPLLNEVISVSKILGSSVLTFKGKRSF